MIVRNLVIGAAGFGLFACGACERDAHGNVASVLTQIDSVLLQESDSIYLASLTGLAIDDSGAIFISDALNGDVLQFSSDGALVRQFGRRGAGPGEFASPVALAVLDDSLLAVADWGLLRTSLFNKHDGSFVCATSHRGYPYTIEGARDTLWMGDVNRSDTTGLAVWRPCDDSMRYMGPLPTAYETPQIMDVLAYATLTRTGDTIMEVFPAHPAIFLSTLNGSVFDSVEMPARRRRGVSPHLVEEYGEGNLSNEDAASLVSFPITLHRLSSGGIAVLYLDLHLDGRLVTADGYLSVLDHSFQRACVDIPMEFSPDGRPVAAFRGDTLLVAEQRIVSDTRAVAYVRSYVLNTGDCEWVPVADPPRQSNR